MRVYRVAITGLGTISPSGLNVETSFENLVKGIPNVGIITNFDPTDFKVKIGAEVKDFDPTQYIEKKYVSRFDRFAQFSLAAGIEAFQDADVTLNDDQKEQFAVIIGSGIGGNNAFSENLTILEKKGPSRVSPFFITKLIGNMGAAQLAIKFGAKGYTADTVSACASGTNAIGDAFHRIKFGLEKFALAGGTEASITPSSVAGFTVMRALSKRNDDPKRASRPFDKDRDGFVIGEGAGIVFLEEWEHAIERGAKIYAEVVGYGATCDAFHITKPSPDAKQQERCMSMAVTEANISLKDVDYINAHGTSTIANDVTETNAIKQLFKDHAYDIHIHSTKSMVGHMLGAAGGIEAVVMAKTLQTGIIHPTINLENPDPECDLDYTPNCAIQDEVNFGLSNSFGFGGHNFSVLFKRIA
ncbi:MAG: beta-ketoacyl-ACP synthase II [Caldisericia bacterium]|nr:beta-ketoacyl-ACP synthase II [Caldisericia bacterium]